MPAIDTTSGDETYSSTTNHSWSHTASGSDRYVRVKLAWFNGSNDVTAITYGGIAMPLVGTARHPSDGSRVSIYELINPPTGAQTIAVTWASTVSGVGWSRSWTGVHQTTASGAPTQTTGSGTSITQSPASEVGDVVDDLVYCDDGSTLTPDGTQTQDKNIVNASIGVRGAGSTKAGSATSTAMSWAVSPSTAWAYVASAIKPSAVIDLFPVLPSRQRAEFHLARM